LNLEVAEKRHKRDKAATSTGRGRPPPDPPPQQIPAEKPTRSRSRAREESTATIAYPEEENKKARSRTPATKVEPTAKKSKLDSDVAQKSLNKGLDLASQVIKGKTFRKQKAISIAKNVKASVAPQPDSAVTSVKKRVPKAPKAVVLPVKTSGVRGRGRKAITA
jgi:hypothetical protein